MKVSISPSPELENLIGADIFTYGHLPVSAAYCRRLGLIELVNRLVPSQMELKPGLVVQAMVLDTLSGRNPLYRIEEFMADQDVELLLGEQIPAKSFSDTNIARSLDAIFKAGSSKIITELGINATNMFHLDPSIPSYDTTSVSLWGNYKACENEQTPPGPVITHGHSKDHQPQLKQFMIELLCVDRGVPIFGKTLNGNSSDKTSNNKILSNISSIMAKHGLGSGAFVYVADSAMVTEKNLDVIESNLFISRLPSIYSECKRAIEEAVSKNTWYDIGILAETKTGKSRPCASYKTYDTSVELHGKHYRAVVVHSSAHDKRQKKKLNKAIATSIKSINDELKKLDTVYYCEADAKMAAKKAENISGKLHTVKTSINTKIVRKQGRPPKNGTAPMNTRYILSWELIENSTEVECIKFMAGCFVLLTNDFIGKDGAMDGKKILQVYKGQYGVESDFAFLKDPLIVNDIFLKTPSRIDVLGMVLIIALMVWRLMERSMRTSLQNDKTDLEGWCKRKTTKPTSFMMTKAIVGIMVAIINNKRIFLCRPGSRPRSFLAALGVEPEVFLEPSYKCRPIIPDKMLQKG